MSFVFYDTETTGTNTAFDQILQFGAIKTDYELRELERFEIRCRLSPHIVPSPGAMRVTGVTADQLADPALPSHYEMVRAVKAKLEEWSPAVFIGYNSIGFDEHLLRQALYQTLHGPYLTNTNGNCRTDSLRIVRAVERFAPGVLAIPTDERGKPVFKLDQLAPANGFDHGAAHDAMADVEATIYLCQLLAERVPGYWSSFVRYAQKAAATEFAFEEDVFSFTDIYFGTLYSFLVTGIGVNPEKGSDFLVFDLAIDPDELAGLPDDELAARLAARPKPVRAMRTNAGPLVVPYDDAPDHMRCAALELDELRRRAGRINNDAGLCDRLITAYLETREAREPSIHVEEQIYDSFTGKGDYALLDQFHQLEWMHRPRLLGRLADERLQLLGQRLIHAEAPDILPEAVRHEHDTAIACRLMAHNVDVPWLTLSKAIEEANDLIAVAQGGQTALLTSHLEFLRQRSEWAAALLD